MDRGHVTVGTVRERHSLTAESASDLLRGLGFAASGLRLRTAPRGRSGSG